ncbi:unnamed protein product [Brassica oleracea]
MDTSETTMACISISNDVISKMRSRSMEACIRVFLATFMGKLVFL